MLNGTVWQFTAVVFFSVGLAFVPLPVRAQVGLWRFDDAAGSAIAVDDSFAGNDGTLVGDVFFTNDPERGSVLRFGGTGWVDVGAFVTELGAAEFTSAFWLKTTETGGVMVSKQSDDGAFARSEKMLYVSVGNQTGGSPAGAVSMLGNAVAWISSTGPRVNDGEWHHIAMSYRSDLVGSAPGTVYVDGEPAEGYVRQNWNGRLDNSDDTFFIGRAPQVGAEGVTNLVGLLDDVAMYGSALNACEVRAVMEGDFSLASVEPEAPVIGAPDRDKVVRGFTYGTQLEITGCPFPNLNVVEPAGAGISATGFLAYDTTFEPPGSDVFEVTVDADNVSDVAEASWTVDLQDPAELAGLWRFEQLDDGRTAVDCSTAGNHGTLTDGARFFNDPERGSVIRFDGAGWVNVGAFVADLGADFTAAVWVKTAETGGVMVSKQSDDGAFARGEKMLYVDAGERDSGAPAGAITILGNGVNWIASAGPAVNDDEWHHVALTFQADRLGNEPGVIYVDGEPVDRYVRQNYNGRADNPPDTLFIGRTPQPRTEGTTNFIGLLDDVAIFNIVLSQDEILSVMDGGFDGFFGFAGATADDCLGPIFQRGDCNSDGAVDLSDGVAMLNRAFLAADPPGCEDACDFNADGALDVTTAVFFFNALFLAGPLLPAPRDCGSANLLLGCEESTCPR
jgi:sorbitol-specific phosphotransferase system component IIA